MSRAVSAPSQIRGLAASSGLGTPLPDRDGASSRTEGAPSALHLLETVAMLEKASPSSSRRKLRVVRRELLRAAADLDRVGLVALSDAGAGHGVWVSLSESGRRLLKTGSGRRVG